MEAKVLISHPTANVFSLALAKHMIEVQKLHSFWTSLAWSSKHPVLNLFPSKLRAQLERRSVDPIFSSFVRAKPFVEIGRLAAIALGIRGLYSNENALFSIDAVYQYIDKYVASRVPGLDSVQMLYAYEDGAYHTFSAGKQLGKICAYDLPIAYWSLRKQLFTEEIDRYPEWAPTIRGLTDSQSKLDRKTQEISLADIVICPSDFVKNSIPPEIANRSKLVVVPFGSPVSAKENTGFNINSISNPLSVLFVASMSQRKGLADLFSAIRMIPSGSVKLKIIGSPVLPLEFYRKWGPDFEYLGTMPRATVLKHMREADVMVLPSIAEGRALVTQEALSQGLPIIITPNTGAEDLIHSGENGFVVPIRSPEAIAEKLNWFCENRKNIEDMKTQAKNSILKFTWRNYAVKITKFLESFGD